MTNDGGAGARDAAGQFGNDMNEAAEKLREGFEALEGKPGPAPQATEDDGGNVTININR